MSIARIKIFSLSLIATVFSSTFIGLQAYGDATDVFPTGPYTTTLVGEKILYPSLFNVASGLPVADVSGVQLTNGKIRAYVFAQYQGIVIAESSDGKTFEKVGNAFGGDKGQGMPRVLKLSDGKYRMYNNSGSGISCSISNDGLTFTVEKSNCISSSGLLGSPAGLTGPGIIKLPNGTLRAYFSDMVMAGTGPDPHQIYSATSTDGLNWTSDSGVRIGASSTTITRSGEHPTAAVHSDGSVTIFYFDNEARPGKDSSGKQNMAMGSMGLYYATSTDGGLTFSNENKISFPATFPRNFGNDPDVFLDKDGAMILWAGGFDPSLGGYIGAVKLTKSTATSTSTPTPTPTAKTGKMVTFTCTKGKQSVRSTGPVAKCPSGWKLSK